MTAEERLRAMNVALWDLVASWESNIDWSNGRSDYGDNAAYEACARDLRRVLDD